MHKKESDSKKIINKFKSKLLYQPRNISLLNELAGLYFNLNDFKNAIKYYEEILKIDKNAITTSNLALCYQMSLDFSKAIYLFHDSIQIDPNYYPAYINLGNVYGSIGRHDQLLRCSLNALDKWPSNSELHSNVGVALMGLGHHKEARISLETALLLDENSIDALINIASIESYEGNHLKAIEIFESILTKSKSLAPARVVQAKYSLAFEYLNSGRLTDGWENYEYGFDSLLPHQTKRNPNRNFSVPKWDGIEITEKTLMVWGEQGVGDEILFSSIFLDIAKDVKNIIVECEPRLVNIFQRSFPFMKVRQADFDSSNRNFQNIFDYDYQIPMGSLNKFYRKDLASFQKADNKYLISDKILNEKYCSRLSKFKEKLKIGIIWRSGLLNPLRNIHYTNLLDWKVIFQLNNAEFINLQYGDCEEELIEAEEKFNLEIHRWSDVDLKNDLDDVTSIIENLDLVIAPCTATAWLSAGIGKPTLIFQQRDWVNLGQDNFPFNKNVKSFFPSNKEQIAETLIEIRSYIDQFFYSGN
jgi:tetratricopeptide (TPR) repeat protein